MSLGRGPENRPTSGSVAKTVRILAPEGSPPGQFAAALELTTELEAARNDSPYFFNSETRRPVDPALLGNKAARLVEMTRLGGVPIPPFFTLTTESYQVFNRHEEQLPEIIWGGTLRQIGLLEEKTGCQLGDENSPLVVSVRSGAPQSMPGLLRTILNVGLNDETVFGLSQRVGEWCAWDSYRRGIESFATNVLEMEVGPFLTVLRSLREDYSVSQNQELPVEALKEAVSRYKEIVKEGYGQDFPQDSKRQLRLAIEAVFRSWNSQTAISYRKAKGNDHQEGTAVTIQEMVFGNSSDGRSGTGVYFTRNPLSEEPDPQVIYGPGVQGSDIMGEWARHHLSPLSALPKGLREELLGVGRKLEDYFGFPQEVEFTTAQGELWILQTREAQLSPLAILAVLKDSVESGKISLEEAVRRLGPARIETLLTPGLDPQELEKAISEGRHLAQGIPLCPGIAWGKIVKSLEKAQEKSSAGLPVILALRRLTTAELMSLPDGVKGIILRLGGAGSHNTQLLRNLRGGQGIPTLSGIEVEELSSEKVVTIDASQSMVLAGEIPLAQRLTLSSSSQIFLEKVEKAFRENPWLAVSYSFDDKQRQIFPAREEWQSPKARTIELMNALIPREIRMDYRVISPRQVTDIRAALEKILTDGDEASLRTCHNPAKLAQAPWQRFNQKEEVDPFLTNDYLRWLEDPALTEIIIGRLPQGVLDPALADEHCVFTVSYPGGRHILLQVLPHSAQLRDLEEVDPQKLITIMAEVDPEGREGLGQITIKYGVKLENDLQAQEFAKLVSFKVLEDWWRPPYFLPHRLAALTALARLNSLDGQARLSKGNSWCLIYDLKGPEV